MPSINDHMATWKLARNAAFQHTYACIRSTYIRSPGHYICAASAAPFHHTSMCGHLYVHTGCCSLISLSLMFALSAQRVRTPAPRYTTHRYVPIVTLDQTSYGICWLGLDLSTAYIRSVRAADDTSCTYISSQSRNKFLASNQQCVLLYTVSAVCRAKGAT